ncbi:hypothetical protein [Oxynema aestuarii]|uniref:Uncharacterized protein n=1 Tax=Oxynema aestuarii AP17 TaxID=2064643 RepID=A0A6H1U3U2_9CYAN|nr:hypothetical protein [Oxynema aestuarii]QIZ73325.1 hypothetical protein HCG48_24240 [Oxynema aestuarii AP17]
MVYAAVDWFRQRRRSGHSWPSTCGNRQFWSWPMGDRNPRPAITKN